LVAFVFITSARPLALIEKSVRPWEKGTAAKAHKRAEKKESTLKRNINKDRDREL